MIEFDYTKTIILENEYVKLSPLELEHTQGLLPLAKNPEIWTFFLDKGIGDVAFNQYIFAALNNRKQKKEYPLVVYDKLKNQYAGMTRLYAIDTNLQTVKIGHTWYGKQFQGTGLNKHCKYLLFKFVFEKLNMVRIGFGVHAQNLRSIHALESVGCKREGVLRDFLHQVDGIERADLVLLSLLNKEWTQQVKSEIKNKINSLKQD